MAADEPKPTALVTDQPHAPVVYFEEAPALAHLNGLISVTLTARFQIPDGQGGISTTQLVTGYLRTNVVGAKILRESLDKVILLAQPTETVTKN